MYYRAKRYEKKGSISETDIDQPRKRPRFDLAVSDEEEGVVGRSLYRPKLKGKENVKKKVV